MASNGAALESALRSGRAWLHFTATQLACNDAALGLGRVWLCIGAASPYGLRLHSAWRLDRNWASLGSHCGLRACSVWVSRSPLGHACLCISAVYPLVSNGAALGSALRLGCAWLHITAAQQFWLAMTQLSDWAVLVFTSAPPAQLGSRLRSA
jgi:hypothetical protein